MELAPVLFLSHGTTMLLGEDSKIRDYWTKLGRDALKHGVRGIIIMVGGCACQPFSARIEAI